MKRAILIAVLSLFTATAFCQTTTTAPVKHPTTVPVKVDSPAYTLSEPQITQIYDLLAFGDNCASNSTQVTTNQWKAYHEAIMKIDSFIRVEYTKRHPVKEQAKPEGGKKP